MESMKGGQVKKVKKKQVKDELDRMKQAEKKRRRLEKALATSAAIRSELEKKKQQKKEEQERLDEEGAAIAEAVALHVLIGEDSDDPRIAFKEGRNNLGDWHHGPNTGFFMGRPGPRPGPVFSRQNFKRCSIENMSWFPDPYGYGSPYGSELTRTHVGDLNNKHPFGRWNCDDYSAAGVVAVAAQAVAALQIREETQVDVPVYFNRY